jgi:hypothetical protein
MKGKLPGDLRPPAERRSAAAGLQGVNKVSSASDADDRDIGRVSVPLYIQYQYPIPVKCMALVQRRKFLG